MLQASANGTHLLPEANSGEPGRRLPCMTPATSPPRYGDHIRYYWERTVPMAPLHT
ncbi:MAG: hypothetical protein ABI072_09180 [Edaphobacter sp.]